MEAELPAQEQWTNLVNDLVMKTMLANANSWYTGSNVPGKKRVILTYTGGLPAYVDSINEAAKNGYEGFNMTKETVPA